MSSMIRTPWPSRSAPHHCSACQIDGSPKASPAWIVKWKFSRLTYSKASRWRVGGCHDAREVSEGLGVPLCELAAAIHHRRQAAQLDQANRRLHVGQAEVETGLQILLEHRSTAAVALGGRDAHAVFAQAASSVRPLG